MSPMNIASSMSGGAALSLAALSLIANVNGRMFPLPVYLSVILLGSIAGLVLAYRVFDGSARPR